MRRHEFLVAGSRCDAALAVTRSVMADTHSSWVRPCGVSLRMPQRSSATGPAYSRLNRPVEGWLDGRKIAQTPAGDKFLDLLLPAGMQVRDLAVLLTV